MSLTIHNDDNLAVLERLAATGEKFDLIELDGPYGANLEGWDVLDEDALLAHYTARLPLVARCLQPWGVSFLFGYPEGCAEIKAWARTSGTLHLRRWLTWYVQQTAHAGRRCQAVLAFLLPDTINLWAEFKVWLRARRLTLGMTCKQGRQAMGLWVHPTNGNAGWLWFESDSSDIPTRDEYTKLKSVFSVPDYFDVLCDLRSYEGLTNLDFITVPVERAAQLNDDGLRSKPIGLYDTLFRPVVPPREHKRALVLYGGSGNAAIAAGKLGYEVVCVEQDAARCEMIRRRWAWQVERRDETPADELGPLFQFEEARS